MTRGPERQERLSISLPPERVAELRAFAARETRGKVSPAVALLIARECHKVDGKERALANLT